MNRNQSLPSSHEGERRTTWAAFAGLLCITTGHTLLETARDAFFLTRMPVSRLPWLYLGIVGLALGLSSLKSARVSGKLSVAGALVMGACVTLTFGFFLQGGATSSALLYALYLWTGLFGSWVMVQVWTLLGRVYAMDQAKRLYGFIGAGAVLGGVVGATLARVVLGALTPRAAVSIAALLFAAAAIPCLLMVVPPLEASRAASSSESEAKPPRPLSAAFGMLLDNAFARRVLGIVLISTVTVTVADYLFKSRIASELKDPRELGTYLSSFYAVTNGLALFAQVVVAPWVFRRAGVRRALLVFPGSILLASLGLLFSGGALAAAVVLKGLDGALRYSIHKTSTELLLVPVPDVVRDRIKPVIDMLGARGGQAVASVGILLLVAVGAANSLTLGAIVLVVAVMWLSLVVTIRSLYLDAFRETLRSGGLSGKIELPELDLGALETIFAGLNSSRDPEVIASLELLAAQHRERLVPALILYHPSRDVVLRALEIFTIMGRTDFVLIADRLNGHPEREVAAAALRARTVVLPDQELLLRRLDEDCPYVSATALVALMVHGWIEHAEAQRRLETVKASSSWQSACALASSIRAFSANVPKEQGAVLDALLIEIDQVASAPGGQASVPTTGELKLRTDLQVRLEVAGAMEARRSPSFVPSLVQMLTRHELRAAARAALVEIPGALGALEHAMSSPDFHRDLRVHLPRTMSMFEPNAAAQALLRRLNDALEGNVRFRVIRGLVKLKRMHPELKLDPTPLVSALEETMALAEQLGRWQTALSTGEDANVSPRADLQAAHLLLVDLLRDKREHAVSRVLSLLELLWGGPFDDVERGLRSPRPKARASSLELLENLVHAPFRTRVMALVEDESTEPERELNYTQALAEVLAHPSRTLYALASYRALELGIDPQDFVSGAVRDARWNVGEGGGDLFSPLLGVRRAEA